MNTIRSLFRRLFRGRGHGAEEASPEALRADFAMRYHNFRMLITANNKALEIMSDIEKALEGSHPFGMAFVRSHCTAVSVNVFKIVKHLDELAPGKYTELFPKFKAIQIRVNSALAGKTMMDEGGPLTLPFSAVDRDAIDLTGSKMAIVAEIRNRVGLPTPPGFVITSSAYREFMSHRGLKSEINRRIQMADLDKMERLFELSSEIQRLIIDAPLPAELEAAIMSAYDQVEAEAGRGVRVSVRSSAIGEDAAGVSFAGQFRSLLNVSRESLTSAYKEVLAGKYGLAGITYRLNRGIPDESVMMCVGCMAMVEAVAGGVLYTGNPVDSRDTSIVINSVWGLPKAVVDGSVDPDVLVVSRGDPPKITRKTIGVKTLEYVCYPEEGLCRMEVVGGRSSEQSISDDSALRLAAMAVALEDYYGGPQDVEWAITEDERIFILQCRPLPQVRTSFETGIDGEAPPGPVIIHGGVTASPGTASGKVFIIRNDMDKLRFPQGAVMVTSQALPGWAPLLGAASAVITEVGGVTGHLANVAREFGVPALFGVPGAVNALEHAGDVTVDADGLTVYEGIIELPERTAHRKNLMKGSPVYQTLKDAASHIIPLNLLDPESVDFRPSHCETFHDITRFCHEKSVIEMFNFGKDHKFSERSGKQLFYKVPMQWWILNLDDGFKEETPGKFVQLDNIASIPMLAIWEGAVAVPWEGPPAIDGKGFMSIMMQATTNPFLDPAAQSPYTARNYFMISKNFCSLSSRFGFHFSTIEALVGERASENYVSFSFKGGAADRTRRARRASFVAAVLEEFGFRVSLKGDASFARIEGRDEEFMKSRLRILGYLIMHTRQLDMVMSNDAEVLRYRQKFREDIQNLIKPDGAG
jgi:pyruvate,water dikinase